MSAAQIHRKMVNQSPMDPRKNAPAALFRGGVLDVPTRFTCRYRPALVLHRICLKPSLTEDSNTGSRHCRASRVCEPCEGARDTLLPLACMETGNSDLTIGSGTDKCGGVGICHADSA
jgi:hypothetical protein